MITQTFKQGDHEIKIESAESIEDAKKNNFKEGTYSKYFLDGKIVENYSALIQFIVGNAKKNNEKLIPNEKDLMKTRNEILKNQTRDITKQLEELKKHYGDSGVNQDTLNYIDGMIDKLDSSGVRVVE